MAKISIDQRPEGMDCGLARVVVFSSQSRERKHYTMVFQGEKGGVQCSCEGWQNHGHCWHIEKLTEDQLRRPDGSEADVDENFTVKLSKKEHHPDCLHKEPGVTVCTCWDYPVVPDGERDPFDGLS